MKENIKEFPEFVVNAISDVVTQYILETNEKNQETILHFSFFSESLVFEIQESMKVAKKLETESNITYIYEIAEERKKIILNNYDLYKQLEHLLLNHIPEYIIISIIKATNEVMKSFKKYNKIETRDFYCRFGENLALDLQNYMLLNQS